MRILFTRTEVLPVIVPPVLGRSDFNWGEDRPMEIYRDHHLSTTITGGGSRAHILNKQDFSFVSTWLPLRGRLRAGIARKSVRSHVEPAGDVGYLELVSLEAFQPSDLPW